MSNKITVNASELNSITATLDTIIAELESSYDSLQSILSTEYYVDGQAKGQVAMFTTVSVRMDELISHYARLKEYVSFAGQTFVELDQSISNDINTKE